MHLFIEHGIEQKCGTDFSRFIESYESINHDLWHKYSLQLTTKAELRYQRFYRAFIEFGLDDLELSHHWAEEYLKISPYKTHLIDGTMDVLDYLKSKYTLHLITNGFREVQHIKLECCNLKPYFKQIIISEEHGVNKPDIKIFQLAENLSGTTNRECVMIGDNYDADILGAINASWKAVYFSQSPASKPAADFLQIQKLKELKQLF